ncbi:calcium binding EGF domain-containing protein [Aphelenchoides avenae]|nr:calcium binding EGF domain-containing protein [Aphelenchus avenae]
MFPEGVENCTSSESGLTIVDEDVKLSDGLAVDWVHGLIFGADVHNHKIVVRDLRTMLQRDVVTGIRDPRSLAVDPGMGMIFWADGVERRIE